jgi:dihydroorotase
MSSSHSHLASDGGIAGKLSEFEIVLPAGIDLHVHFREPGMEQKETMASGIIAARETGIATVVDMPNTIPPTDTYDNLIAKMKMAESYPGIIVSAGMTNNSVKSKQLKKMAKHAKILKCFLADSTGKLGIDEKNLKKGIKQISKINCIIFFHAEDPSYIRERTENSIELEVRPSIAEIESIKHVIELSHKFPNQKMHVTHVSTLEGGKLLLKETSENLSWDVLHKYLSFTTDLVAEKGNLAKMNPPLRTLRDRDGLLELLQNDKIPMVTSDHAPHTVSEKLGLVAGAPGVQELYPFLIDLDLRGVIPRNVLENVIYHRPKALLQSVGLDNIEGTVVVNTNENYVFDSSAIRSSCQWSLWEDYVFRGKITQTNFQI